jgi:hypothetical protein
MIVITVLQCKFHSLYLPLPYNNNYLFDKKKGKQFFLFIEHEVLFYETPFFSPR